MNSEQAQFLGLVRRFPGRLTVEQVAWLLNCQPHDVPILVSARLLKPLGDAPPSSVKYFATQEVLERANDRAWLVKMTNVLNGHWREHNARRKSRRGGEAVQGQIDRVPDGHALNPMV